MFFKDVKKVKGVSILGLQVKIVTDFLQVEVKKTHWDYVQWFDQIQTLKVFLVINDVSERKQFDDLILDLK